MFITIIIKDYEYKIKYNIINYVNFNIKILNINNVDIDFIKKELLIEIKNCIIDKLKDNYNINSE